jgi:hypothetical protein
MTLELLEKEYAVCRLKEPCLPGGEFVSLTMSGGEVSLVCEAALAPGGGLTETGWRGLRVAGVLDFSLVGILAALTAALAEAGVPVFAVSTYDTDYLFVKAENLDAAIRALISAGHKVTGF